MPSQEELDAVEETRKLRLPEPTAHFVALGRSLGHQLVSQGCGLFRCVACNVHAFMDEASTLSWDKCKP